MRKIQLKRRADGDQLIEELAARGVTAKVRKVAGGHEIEVPEEADGVAVDDALRRHVPASLLEEVRTAKDLAALRSASAELFELLLARQ